MHHKVLSLDLKKQKEQVYHQLLTRVSEKFAPELHSLLNDWPKEWHIRQLTKQTCQTYEQLILLVQHPDNSNLQERGQLLKTLEAQETELASLLFSQIEHLWKITRQNPEQKVTVEKIVSEIYSSMLQFMPQSKLESFFQELSHAYYAVPLSLHVLNDEQLKYLFETLSQTTATSLIHTAVHIEAYAQSDNALELLSRLRSQLTANTWSKITEQESLINLLQSILPISQKQFDFDYFGKLLRLFPANTVFRLSLALMGSTYLNVPRQELAQILAFIISKALYHDHIDTYYLADWAVELLARFKLEDNRLGKELLQAEIFGKSLETIMKDSIQFWQNSLYPDFAKTYGLEFYIVRNATEIFGRILRPNAIPEFRHILDSTMLSGIFFREYAQKYGMYNAEPKALENIYLVLLMHDPALAAQFSYQKRLSGY